MMVATRNNKEAAIVRKLLHGVIWISKKKSPPIPACAIAKSEVGRCWFKFIAIALLAVFRTVYSQRLEMNRMFGERKSYSVGVVPRRNSAIQLAAFWQKNDVMKDNHWRGWRSVNMSILIICKFVWCAWRQDVSNTWNQRRYSARATWSQWC